MTHSSCLSFFFLYLAPLSVSLSLLSVDAEKVLELVHKIIIHLKESQLANCR